MTFFSTANYQTSLTALCANRTNKHGMGVEITCISACRPASDPLHLRMSLTQNINNNTEFTANMR